jgi:hypothetical protein
MRFRSDAGRGLLKGRRAPDEFAIQSKYGMDHRPPNGFALRSL